MGLPGFSLKTAVASAARSYAGLSAAASDMKISALTGKGKIEGLTLAEDAAGESRPLLSADRVEFSVKPLSLATGVVELKSIAVSGLVLTGDPVSTGGRLQSVIDRLRAGATERYGDGSSRAKRVRLAVFSVDRLSLAGEDGGRGVEGPGLESREMVGPMSGEGVAAEILLKIQSRVTELAGFGEAAAGGG